MVIYLIHNTVNGKYYVGKTVKPLSVRWSQHVHAAKNGSNTYLHRAMQKHGVDNFKMHPLMSTLTDGEELKKWEVFLIGLFHANHRETGYNISRGGDGGSFPKSEETKRKISASEKGKRDSAETRQKKSKTRTGMKHAPNTIRKMTRRGKYPAGVYAANGGRQFQARITKDGKRVHLGCFKTVEEASQAYERAFNA